MVDTKNVTGYLDGKLSGMNGTFLRFTSIKNCDGNKKRAASIEDGAPKHDWVVEKV